MKDLNKVQNELSLDYGIDVVTISKDLFEQNAAEDVYNEVKERGIKVNVLVNDAGQGAYGPFVATDLQRQLQIVQLNIVALTSLTYLFLRDMLARNEGKILPLAWIVSEIPATLGRLWWHKSLCTFIYQCFDQRSERF